jgi:hypothetical protein
MRERCALDGFNVIPFPLGPQVSDWTLFCCAAELAEFKVPRRSINAVLRSLVEGRRRSTVVWALIDGEVEEAEEPIGDYWGQEGISEIVGKAVWAIAGGRRHGLGRQRWIDDAA